MDIVQDVVGTVLSFSSDAIIIAVLVGIFSTYSIFYGKGKTISLILGFYPAVFIFGFFPFFKEILKEQPENLSQAIIQVIIFLSVFIPVVYIVNKFISDEFSFSRIRRIFEAGALGLASSFLAILFSYKVVNLQKLYNFSPAIDSLFLGNTFWWLIAPFIIIFLIRR